MAAKSWTLTDLAKDEHRDALQLGADDLGTAAQGCRVTKRTLRGGLREGVDVVEVDNGRFRFTVIPTRGMGIWRGWLGQLELGWRSPNQGPVHPAFVPLMEEGGLGWLDGFDEWIVRCGLESNGAPALDERGKVLYPLHGKIANRPAHRVVVSVDEQTGEIAVSGQVDETRFHFQKLRLHTTIKTRPGEAGLRIHDEIENLSASPAGAQLLYHVNFGRPLLESGSRFVAPLKTVVPRNAHAASGIKTWDSYAAEEPGFEEQVYFLQLLADKNGATRSLLKDAHSTKGASLHFNVKQLPWYTVWKNTTAAEDGYVTGIEPGTNFPNPRPYEATQDRVVKLAGRARAAFDLGVEIHADAGGVQRAEKSIAAIQGDTQTKVFDHPQDGWCAPG